MYALEIKDVISCYHIHLCIISSNTCYRAPSQSAVASSTISLVSILMSYFDTPFTIMGFDQIMRFDCVPHCIGQSVVTQVS